MTERTRFTPEEERDWEDRSAQKNPLNISWPSEFLRTGRNLIMQKIRRACLKDSERCESSNCIDKRARVKVRGRGERIDGSRLSDSRETGFPVFSRW